MLRVGREVSVLSGDLVAEVRLALNGRGFIAVPTRPFLDDRVFLRSTPGGEGRPFRGERWRQSPELARYGACLERLVGLALPEESLGLTQLEYRHEPAGSQDQEVDRLHVDGSYLRSVYTLYGPATIYRDGNAELTVPRGRTLLMTAMGRAVALNVPCTLHRRPGAGAERAVIVCSFEPRPEPAEGEDRRRPVQRRGRRERVNDRRAR